MDTYTHGSMARATRFNMTSAPVRPGRRNVRVALTVEIPAGDGNIPARLQVLSEDYLIALIAGSPDQPGMILIVVVSQGDGDSLAGRKCGCNWQRLCCGCRSRKKCLGFFGRCVYY